MKTQLEKELRTLISRWEEAKSSRLKLYEDSLEQDKISKHYADMLKACIQELSDLLPAKPKASARTYLPNSEKVLKETLKELVYNIREIEEVVPASDFKVDVDLENYDYEPSGCEVDELLGIKNLKDFFFCGYRVGGDWQSPLFLIVYLDNKNKLRVYIPKDGNVYNFSTKSVYGDDDEADLKDAQKRFWKDIEDVLDIEHDVSAIKNDIKKRFGLG